MDKFVPTPQDKLSDLPTNPDSILSRTLPAKPEDIKVDGVDTATYNSRGYLHLGNDHEERTQLIEKAGIERIAFTEASYVIRARDSQGAAAVQASYIESDDRTAVDGPEGVPTARCIEIKDPAPDTSRYYCYIAYRQYVGIVNGNDLSDLQRKAAAQYAVLANNEI